MGKPRKIIPESLAERAFLLPAENDREQQGKQGEMERSIMRRLLGAVLLLLLIVAAGVVSWPSPAAALERPGATTTPTPTTDEDDTPRLVVGRVEEYLNVRSGAGTDYPMLSSDAVLEKGTLVDVLATSQGKGCEVWFKVRLSSKNTGWVCGAYVKIGADEEEEATATPLAELEPDTSASAALDLPADGPLSTSDLVDLPLLRRPAPNPYYHALHATSRYAAAAIPLSERFTPQKGDEVEQITPGVVHIQRETDDPLKINILLFDMLAPEFNLRVAVGDGWLSGRTRTSYMALQNEALAAVNGDLFSGTGIPQGLTIINSKVATAPKHRATFAWTHDGEPFIGYFTNEWTWDAEVVAPNGERVPLGPFNSLCSDDTICLYNDFYRVVPDYQNDVKVFLSPRGEVSRITQKWNQKIPPDGRVLRGLGEGAEWLLENVEEGDTVQINIRTRSPLSDYAQAISGGPLILYRGRFVEDCMCTLADCSNVSEAYDDNNEDDNNEAYDYDEDEEESDLLCEEFDLDWKEHHYRWVRMPRTAVGYDRWKRTLIVVVVDGYQRGYSRGIQQEELADLMREFDTYTAMELDGGGSVTMVLEDEIVNRPSDDTGERFVANALLFFWNEFGERD